MIAHCGDTKILSTIEQAKHLLKHQWPENLDSESRDLALGKIRDAMECVGSIGGARRAVILAAKRAGYRTETMAI